MNFIFTHKREVATLTAEHLWLVAIAMLIAIAIGVPLGILLTRQPKLKALVLGSTNVIQTIPSLALFGLLLPLPWLGARADRLAIVALSAVCAAAHRAKYLRRDIRQSSAGARGRGRDGADVVAALMEVEMPLASPVMLAGIRTAAVITIGVATIAAAIGAGGLGEFIFRGIAMVDNGVILAGALPAAAMALIADLLLGSVEKMLARRRH